MSLLEEMPRNKIKENKKAIWGLIVDTPPPKAIKFCESTCFVYIIKEDIKKGQYT
jgi:hypothetical protein